MKKYNSVLKDALYELKLEELDALPDEDEIEHEFSNKFNKQTKKLIKSEKSKSKALKVAASIAVILIISVSLPTVNATDKIFDFFINIYNNVLNIKADYYSKSNQAHEITTFYFLNETPEGCRVKYYSTVPYILRYQIANKDKSIVIYFTQSLKIYSGENNINTKDAYVEYLDINSIKNVIFIDNGETIYCIWDEHGYRFELSYTSSLGKDFLYKNIGKLYEFDVDNPPT